MGSPFLKKIPVDKRLNTFEYPNFFMYVDIYICYNGKEDEKCIYNQNLHKLFSSIFCNSCINVEIT